MDLVELAYINGVNGNKLREIIRNTSKNKFLLSIINDDDYFKNLSDDDSAQLVLIEYRKEKDFESRKKEKRTSLYISYQYMNPTIRKRYLEYPKQYRIEKVE